MDDEICLPSIRLWCEVLEDANPLYYDREYARTTRHGGIVAPPTMIMTWCVRPEWMPQGDVPSITESLASSLPEYPHAVGLRSLQRHSRPLHLGERLLVEHFVADPSPETTTERGPGRRVKHYFSFKDDGDNEVASLEMEVLRFQTRLGNVAPELPLPRPGREDGVLEQGAEDPTPQLRRRPLVWADVDEGEIVPPVALPLTLKRCIKWVAATRDYNEVHHDREFARTTGALDLFIGVHFFHGLVGRFITDWSGPTGEIREMEFKSWGRCYPGEVPEVVGYVVRKYRRDGEGLVDVAVACNCQRGRLYDVAVTVYLPDDVPTLERGRSAAPG